MTSPAFQFYPNDWLSSPRIALMSPAQEGGYIRLLCYDWTNDGIPDQPDKICHLTRLPEDQIRVVIDCFIPHPSKPGFLTNERLQKERQKQVQWRQKSSDGGKKGSARRWNKGTSRNHKGGHEMVNGWSLPKHDSSSSSSSSDEDIYKKDFPEIPPMNRESYDQLVNLRGWDTDMAEWFWNDCEKVNWLDGKGRLIVNIESALKNLAVKWKGNPSRNGGSGSSEVILTDKKWLEERSRKDAEECARLKKLMDKQPPLGTV